MAQAIDWVACTIQDIRAPELFLGDGRGRWAEGAWQGGHGKPKLGAANGACGDLAKGHIRCVQCTENHESLLLPWPHQKCQVPFCP